MKKDPIPMFISLERLYHRSYEACFWLCDLYSLTKSGKIDVNKLQQHGDILNVDIILYGDDIIFREDDQSLTYWTSDGYIEQYIPSYIRELLNTKYKKNPLRCL